MRRENLQDLDRILPLTEAKILASRWRDAHYTIATLNGSFDLLHAGHLHIVNEAAAQADRLIVGLNSDVSIQMYKSPSRPIIPLKYRLQMLAALRVVDAVTWFDEITPMRFIEMIHPHVHVNGAEYGSSCVEAECVQRLGTRLHIVELVPGLSTSQIIETIRVLPPKSDVHIQSAGEARTPVMGQ